MNSRWGDVFEYFKERRYAAVFFGTLLSGGGILIAACLLRRMTPDWNLQDYAACAAPGAALVLLAWIASAVARTRGRRSDGSGISPMSRDELNKARSKLLKR